MKKIIPGAFAVAGATALLLFAFANNGQAASDQKHVTNCSDEPCAIILF